jgi:hypothetical protein
MDRLIIQRVSRRYHLGPGEGHLAADLDRATERAFGDPLDTALARLGLDGEEAVCLRRVQLRLDYDPGQSVQRTGDAWSEAIAQAIRRTLAGHGGHHGDDLVRYPSRLHGLVDFALEVSAGRLGRAWAWNQLGWSRLPDPPSLSEARRQLVQALQGEPALLLPLFVRLAQADRLASWMGGLPAAEQRALVHGLLTQGGLSGAESDAAPPTAPLSSRPGQAPFPHSRIARHWSTRAAGQGVRSAIPARHWAWICLLEQEPALGQRPNRVIAAHLADAERQWQRLVGAAPAAPGRHPEPSNREAPELSPAAPVAAATRGSADLVASGQGPGRGPDRLAPDHFDPEPLAPQRRDPVRTRGAEEPAATPAPTAAPEEAEASAPWREPRVHQSAWGGLFYLIALLETPPAPGEAGIATALIESPVFAERSLAWVFFHFFRRLFAPEPGSSSPAPAPCPDADPSLRLLCQLPVDEKIPDFSAPERHEREALAHQASRLTRALGTRLPAARRAGDPWRWLCQRPARLYLDTAWVDVHFALAQLDTDIRRAGLDLDPGYVPWLGRVVKLHYD